MGQRSFGLDGSRGRAPWRAEARCARARQPASPGAALSRGRRLALVGAPCFVGHCSLVFVSSRRSASALGSGRCIVPQISAICNWVMDSKA